MAFPQFDPSKRKLLWFSRGRGRGHAVPDIQIIRELEALRGDLEIRLVSYGTGLAVLEQAGYAAIDIRLPEEGSSADMVALSGQLIGWLKPDLVVSHEEFAPMPAAKIFRRPTVFITDWFGPEGLFSMHCLKFADELVFLQDEGVYPQPSYLSGVRYVGRMRRNFAYERQDRHECRRMLGLPEAAFVIGVVPGAYATEERAPVGDILIPAFEQLDFRQKRLVWLAGEERDALRDCLSGLEGTEFLQELRPWEQLVAAADVIVTKDNRGSALEAIQIGTPVVAVSPGTDPPNDQALAATDGVELVVRDGETDVNDIIAAIQAQAQRKLSPILSGTDVAGRVAERIAARAG